MDNGTAWTVKDIRYHGGYWVVTFTHIIHGADEYLTCAFEARADASEYAFMRLAELNACTPVQDASGDS